MVAANPIQGPSQGWLVVACTALLLAACGGGGGGGGDTPAPTAPDSGSQADYAPLNVGDRWVYRHEDNSLEQQVVTGTRTVQGRTATVLAATTVGNSATDETLYVKTSSALSELADSTDPVSVQIGDISTLQLPLRQGQGFVQVDKSLAQGYDLDGDGKPDAMTIRSDVTVLGFESISGAAGSYTQCAHLRTVLTLSATASSDGTAIKAVSTVDEWYAPALGLVRDSNLTTVSGRRTSTTTTTRELVAYAVAGSKSDARAPALVGSNPAAGSTARTAAQLALHFDKAIDAATLRNGGFSLSGPSGQAIPVTLAQNAAGTDIDIGLSSPLGTGRYTIKLGPGVQDLIGNPLPNQDWFFTLDQSPPAVASAVPASGAVDVALNTTISLQFNEALNPATINTGTVTLESSSGGRVPIRVEMPDARSVLITPLQLLAAAQHYSVVLAPAVADVLGNAVFNSVDATTFDTVQGRLSSATALAGASGRGLSAGDVNGDGRVDLLTIRDDAATDAAAFNLFLQNAAGGFDAPRRIDVAARSGCGSVGIALLADMNGDGRLDIVTTHGNCGVEVYYQNASGAFDRSALLPGLGFTMLKVMDMNGDGRPDVVATAWASSTVSVWRQASDGSWGPETLYPLFNNGYGDLAVGDLNGDGRPDIAVTSGQGDLQKALGIAYQQADGSFGPPQYRALAGTFGHSTLTIADLDGDGRADLLTNSAGVGNLWWFRQLPDGTLAAPKVLGGAGDALKLVVADIDGDGRKDIVIDVDGYHTIVGLQLQRADGSFADAVSFRGVTNPGDPASLVVADLNGDGRLDVALSGPTVLLNLGSASPQSAGVARAEQVQVVGVARAQTVKTGGRTRLKAAAVAARQGSPAGR